MTQASRGAVTDVLVEQTAIDAPNEARWPAWLDDAFWPSVTLQVDVVEVSRGQAFAQVSQLLAHGALFQQVSQPRAKGRGSRPEDRLQAAADALSAPWRKSMRELARLAGANPVTLRTGPVRVNSAHPLARRSLFPEAGRVPELLARLWSRLPAIGCPLRAVQWALCLLLIHPLLDGNGRTARLVYAALLWRLRQVDPLLLLGFALMFERSHSQLQLSFVHLRSGDASQLRTTFEQACGRARTEFAPWVGRLGRAVGEQSSASAQGELENLRQRLLLLIDACPVH